MAAAKKPTQYYRQVMAAAKKGQLESSYFIYGEELYLIDTLIETLSQKFLGKMEKEMNYYIRYAPEAGLGDILALTAGGGLFSDKKVIVYKDYQNLRTVDNKGLLRYLAHPNPDILLIIVARVDNIKLAKFTALQPHTTTVNILTLKENELGAFIIHEFEKYQKKLAEGCVDTLIYLVGEKISDLRTEVAQVANYYKDQPEITPADIEKIVGIYATQNVFELTRHLAQKKLESCLFILHNLLVKGESPGGILFLLLRHIMMLWKIRGCYKSGIRDSRTIQQKLKLYPRAYQQYIGEINNWSLLQLNESINLIHESDQLLKSGGAKPAVILDRLMVQLINVK